MVVAGLKPSTHFPAPSQESVPSQSPPFEVPVQLVVAGANPSVGQAPDVPVQLSATSQGLPFVPRQMVVAGLKPSTHFPAPSQESVPSQSPPFEVPVQAVVEGAKPSAGQAPDVPVQLSATSQGLPFVPRQMVVDGLKPSAGQPGFIPSHVSGTSQTRLAGRHSVPALPGVKTHCPVFVPSGLVTTWQESFVQTSLSLQTLVAQGFNTFVTTRGVQSHFDPVPAC